MADRASAAAVVLVEAEAGAAGAFGGFPVGGGDLGVGVVLAAADQAFKAAPGPFEGGALLGLGGGRAGDPVTFGGQLRLAPTVAGARWPVERLVLLEASGGAGSPAAALSTVGAGPYGDAAVDPGSPGSTGAVRARSGSWSAVPDRSRAGSGSWSPIRVRARVGSGSIWYWGCPADGPAPFDEHPLDG